MEVFRRKSVEQCLQDADDPERHLRRALGPVQLTAIGIGVIIGTGIFVLTGEAAGTRCGAGDHALVRHRGDRLLPGGASATRSSPRTVPIAGSAYSFSYASLGELIAWIIGWDLMLELALGASTVASGWSQYFQVVLTSAPWHAHPPAWIFADHHNLVAAVIVLLLTSLLCFGIRASSTVNAVIVAIKLAIILLVIVAGLSYIHTGNYHPFIPPAGAKPAPAAARAATLLQDLGAAPGAFGVGGIFSGAALVFFAFIGFDIVATNAEETKKPQRDLPLAIFLSLTICAILYVAVSLVVTGMVKYNHIDVKAPLADRVPVGRPEHDRHDHRLRGPGGHHLGDPCAADGPEPCVLCDEPRPAAAAGVLARVAAIRHALPHDDRHGLRRRRARLLLPAEDARGARQHRHAVRVRAGRDRRDRAAPHPARPGAAVPRARGAALPILSVLASGWLMLNLQTSTWIRFGVWMLIGFVVYFGYSMRHSRVGREGGGPREDARRRTVPSGSRPARPAPDRGTNPSHVTSASRRRAVLSTLFPRGVATRRWGVWPADPR